MTSIASVEAMNLTIMHTTKIMLVFLTQLFKTKTLIFDRCGFDFYKNIYYYQTSYLF